MADSTTVNSSKVFAYMKQTTGGPWSSEETEHALEQARKASVPSRFEEDWRKTDPEAFPWAQVEDVDATRTRVDVAVHALGGGRATGLVPLEADSRERYRSLQVISGDDYDARFLYYHKALQQHPVNFSVLPGFKGDPIELVQKASGPGLATFTTVLVIGRGAEVTVYDRWEVGEDPVAAIGRTEILVEEGAKLTYIQEDGGQPQPLYRRARIQLDTGASLLWCAATPGASWHAARLEMAMNGPDTHAVFKGLFTGSDGLRADHRTLQYHNAPRAKSDLMMKTLLSAKARSIYQGTITVPKQAQKTDAYQQCRNLLLESGTHADAIPKLEIIADDVRCSHGASMSSVNKDQVFYLQTRGLTRHQAMVAIATGFAEEIIRFVPIESVQERWRTLVARTIGRVQLA